jgi:hypothetical protein
MHRHRPTAHRAAVTIAAVAAVAAPAAHGAPVQSDLRVETGGSPLAGGSYLTDTVRIETDRREACGGTGEVKTVEGPTALGLLSDGARVHRALRPLGVSDQFDFGLFVCGVGSFVGSDSAFWLYKVDHLAPEVGADQLELKGGEEVLWYFSDTGRNVNTGDELVLRAPARARPGRAFEVTVLAYDSKGARTPAADAQVTGDGVVETDSDGKARVEPDSRGTLRLRAKRGADIPSATVSVCVESVPSRCPARRGRVIFGTPGGDRIVGTAGADRVSAFGGADRIAVRGGGRDRVRCGSGRDRVRADRSDRMGRDCELVRRR